MILDKICIENFKSIKDVKIKIQDKTILVGANNCGKSNILEAINILFGEKNPNYMEPKKSDFNDLATDIVLIAFLTDISTKDLKLIGCSKDKINRIITPAMQQAGHEAVFRLNIQLKSLVQNTDPNSVRIDAVRYYEMDNECYRNGFGNGSEGIRKKLCSFVMIPTIRNIQDELRVNNWTTFGKLIKEIVKLSPHRTAVIQKLMESQNELNSLLSEEKNEIENNVKNYTPIDEIIFSIAKTNEPEEILENLQMLVKTGQFTTDISRMGTGTQSAIIIAILDAYRKKNAGCLGKQVAPTVPLTLLAFEEPELYLHPHGQRKIQKTIDELIKITEIKTQVIFSTHAPILLRNLNIPQITKIIKNNNGETQVLQLALNQIEDIDAFKFKNLVNTEIAEIWFADKIIICEGGDAYILKAIASIQNYSIDEKNVSIIPTGGNCKFSDIGKVLERMSNEVIIITDNDSLVSNKNNARNQIKEILQEKIKKIAQTDPDYNRLNDLINSLSNISSANPQNLIDNLSEFGVFILPIGNNDLEACYSQTAKSLDGVSTNAKERSALIIAEEMMKNSNISNYLTFTKTFENALEFSCR